MNRAWPSRTRPGPAEAAWDSRRAKRRSDLLEIHRQVEPGEPRLDDTGRPQPLTPGSKSGCGRPVVRAIVDGWRVHVEDVVQVDPQISARALVAENLRKPHVELIVAPVGEHLVRVEQVDGLIAVQQLARRQMAQLCL